MKSILITGAGSYIGVSLENDLKQWPESYRVDSLDMRGSDWESHSFRGYDAVFHVAGLVHQPDSKNDPARSDLYDQVNHILAVRTADVCRRFCSRARISPESDTPESRACSTRTSNQESMLRPMNWLETR